MPRIREGGSEEEALAEFVSTCYENIAQGRFEEYRACLSPGFLEQHPKLRDGLSDPVKREYAMKRFHGAETWVFDRTHNDFYPEEAGYSDSPP